MTKLNSFIQGEKKKIRNHKKHNLKDIIFSRLAPIPTRFAQINFIRSKTLEASREFVPGKFCLLGLRLSKYFRH